jgi:hypothetical protein
MCPPTKILFFYSNPLKDVQCVDPNQPSVSITPLTRTFHFLDGTSVQLRPQAEMNTKTISQSFVLDDKNDYVQLGSLSPRDRDTKQSLKQ